MSPDRFEPPTDTNNQQTEMQQARAVLLVALRRYSRATNSAELQLSILAMHEGLRQVIRAWLLRQEHLPDRHREQAEYIYVRFGELMDIAQNHSSLFEGRRSLWLDEISLLLDRRNEIAHPVAEMAADTALAAASGWADLIRRMWPYLLGGDPPDLRHPDPANITASQPIAASSRPSTASLSFYAEPAIPVPMPRRRWAFTYALIVVIVLAVLAVAILFILSQLMYLLPIM